MHWIKALATIGFSTLLAACGGGGGSSGTSGFATGGSTGTGGTGGAGTVAGYSIAVQLQRAAAATTTLSSTETVQAVATVTDGSGNGVEGVVVTFSQGAGSLIAFAPVVATALTDATGHAKVDASAAAASNTGATTITAAANIGSVTVTGSTAIQITAGAPVAGTAPTPAAINFVGAAPSSTAIVIKGAGGTGRSESAILSFRVVDASNAPINAATVDFTLNADNGGATIGNATTTSAVSSSDGLVKVTVSSGTMPASIVVTAAARGAASVRSQSDTLIVSNSVPVAGGFEVVAEKYNVDGRTTGDSTKLTAYVRDAFGNPVPDGVAVSFQTDYGVVASSTLGGCATVNGTCSVLFRVQEPRGNGLATVVASVRVGTNNTLANRVRINMAGATGTPYLALGADGTPLNTLTLTSCKQSFDVLLSDGSGRAPAAGTAISSPFSSTGSAIVIKTGSPVLDQLDGRFSPVNFGIEVDLTSTSLVPACRTGGALALGETFVRFEYKTPGGVVFSQRVGIAYPQ
jgi:hypothetical protein